MKQALKLALPIIAGQLGQVLMGFFDNIQIGGLGKEYIAAVGFSNNLYWMINLLGLGILFSVSPLVSESFGEKHEWKSIGVFKSAIKVALIVAVIFTAITFFFIEHMDVFDQKPVINELSQRYLRILNYSTIGLLLFSVGKQLMDGMGRTKPGMYISLAGLVMNIILNWLLIYGHWGFPALGIEGAALATSISRMAMAAGIFILIWRDDQVRNLRKSFAQSLEKNKSYVWPILKIGFPSGLMIFFEVGAFSYTQMMSGWLGVDYLAAHQIAITLASVTFMVLTGFAAAGTILTGYAYGAKDREGARVAGYAIFVLTIAVEIVFAIFFLATHQLLPLLFTDDVEVLRIASALVVLAAFFQISDGLQAAAAGVLRGLQDVKIPSLIAFMSYWLVMVPVGYILTFGTSLGVNGIWIGFIIGLSVAAVCLFLRFKWRVGSVVFEEL